MSCGIGGKSCETPRRRSAWLFLSLFAAVFAALSIFSFLPSRGQVTPGEVDYGKYRATEGRRVFQAWNCMDCHTVVGNGAYFGPDLTKEYARVGPAWLEAFLPSAGGWPTRAAVQVQLQKEAVRKASGVTSLQAYLEKYPGAAERIARRGGSRSLMPNLAFSQAEVGQLIAFLKYTSAMNTEGWPPKVEVGDFERRLRLAYGPGAVAAATTVPAGGETTTADGKAAAAAPGSAAQGKQLVQTYGCTACHSTGTRKLVGPGWGGLYGSTVTLADGRTVSADDAYLTESILDPDAKIVAGYPKGVMPGFGSVLDSGQVKAVVAYLRTLEKKP